MRISAVVLLALPATLALPSTAGAALLTASPGIAARGAKLTLTASSFERGAPGVISLSGQRIVRFRVDQRGRASVVMRVRRSISTGTHRLIMRAGRDRVSTQLMIVAAKPAASSRLSALSGGQRALLIPTSARPGEPFGLELKGLRRRATTEVTLGGAAVSKGRADARGKLEIIGRIPQIKPGRHRVRVRSGRTRMSLSITVLEQLAPAPPPVPAPVPVPPGPAPPGPVRIAAAGDIACAPGSPVTSQTCRQQATSDLLVGAGYDAVLPLGDIQYYCGSLQAFNQMYHPSWGRVLAQTHPVIGNHEYLTSGDRDCSAANAGGAGYFDYFGARAGTRGQGYYSYDVGSWHLIALNSNCANAGGCAEASPQGRWLAQDLAAHPSRCTLAYWHIPLFSSGGRADSNTRGFWQQLYDAGADVVLSGHDHIYERFAAQDPGGKADPLRGMRQFIVGTGGSNHTPLASIFPNSEVRDTTTYGVLELTLGDGAYDWRFRPESGAGFTDSGRTDCH